MQKERTPMAPRHQNVMRTAGIYFLLLISAFLLFAKTTQAQSVAPCTTAVSLGNFGVDADLYANFPSGLGGDDWFFSSLLPGSGIAIIGTTAATAKPPLAISAAAFRTLLTTAPNLRAKNRIYEQRMSVPFGTFVNGQIMLDALAARDHFSTGGLNDSTMFSGTGDKNGGNPYSWNPSVGNVAQKLDLIDVGGHIRRDATNGHLVGYAFASTLNTSGDDHIDFEIFRTSPVFNALTHVVTNTGPASTGGHTAGFFNSDGTVAAPGDVIVSVDYANGGANPVASVRVWVNPNDLDRNGMTMATLNTKPGRPFTFTGIFDTQLSTGTNGYGYAEIAPFNPSGTCLFYALTNKTFKALGTAWGNLLPGGDFSDSLAILQLAEIAIDFSAFGLDVSTQINQCQALFGSLLVKSRSSGSFTAQQKDYAGPYEFGAAIPVTANAGPDATVDCRPGFRTVQLQGTTTLSEGTFTWTVVPGSGGNIVSGGNTSTPIVNSAGCYALVVASPNPFFTDCNAKDTACVTETVITPPSITCPPSSNQCPGSVPACPANLAAFIAAGGTASGAATPLVYSCSTGPLVGIACNGTYTRTHTITDACQRSVTCTQVFTVVDVTPPTITCPGDRQIDCGASTLPANTGTATTTDNCSATVDYSDVTTSQNCFTYITRTWRAIDGCGNTNTCVQHITITDRTAPAFTCQATVSLTCGAGIPTPAITDNCSNVGQITVFFQDQFTSGGCATSSNRSRTWTAIDASGNFSNCVQQISFSAQRSGSAPFQSDIIDTKASDMQIAAYPNPFNSTVTIEFTSKISSNTKLEIFDLNGSKVAELYKGFSEANKMYKVDFDGSRYSQGVYFYKLSSNDNSFMDRLILIK